MRERREHPVDLAIFAAAVLVTLFVFLLEVSR